MGTSNSQPSMDGGDSSSSSNRSESEDLGNRGNRLRSLTEGYNSRSLIVFSTVRSSSRDVSDVLRPSHIYLGSNEEDEEEGPSVPTPDENETKVLEESEFCLMTKTGCGLKADINSQYSKPPSVLKMLSQREIGKKGGNGFTAHDLSSAMHHFLPNAMTVEDRYQHKAFCGSYSQDGKHFLSACQDRMLRLYRTSGKSFTLLRKIAARDVGWSILDTAFSPDGTCCVYSSWSDSIYHVQLFGDSESQDALQLNPTQSRFCIFSLVFSQDGREILCGSNDGVLYIYDRYSNQPILKINAHSYDVNTVAYADSTSQILYSGGDDGLCKVWDRRTLSEEDPKPVGVLAGHMDGITFIEPRGDGRHFLSNSKDQTIKLWDVRKFSNDEAEVETRRAVAKQHWDYRWQRVPSQFKHIPRRLKGDTSVMTYRGHSVLQTLIRCHFSPSISTGQRYIYTGCAQGRIFIFDALTGQPVKILRGHRACVRDVSWHPYKPELTSTSWDTVVARWYHRGEEESDSSDDEGDRDTETGSAWIRKPTHRLDSNSGGSGSHRTSRLRRRDN